MLIDNLDFIKAGEVRPGLFALASPGYYLTDATFQQKEWLSLQLLCKGGKLFIFAIYYFDFVFVTITCTFFKPLLT